MPFREPREIGELAEGRLTRRRNDFPPALSIRSLNTRDQTQPGAAPEPGLLRTWRWLFAIIGLAMAVVGFYGEESWRGRRAWEKCCRESVARGDPVTAAELLPPPAGDPENFATTPFLAGIFSFRPGTFQPRDTNAAARLHDFSAKFNAASDLAKFPRSGRTNSWAPTRAELPLWYGAFLQATNPPNLRGRTAPLTNFTTQAAAAGVLDAMAESDAVVAELRAASRRPYSRFAVDYATDCPAAMLLPHLAPLKHLCQVLRLRATAELALGRTEESLADIHLMLYLTDACRTEPILISHLVRFAQFSLAMQPIAEGLAGHQWSEAQLKTLQERLQRFDFLADARRALHGERVVFGAGMVDFVRRSHGRFDLRGIAEVGEGGADDLVLPILVRLAPGGWYDFEKANSGRLCQELLLSTLDASRGEIRPATARQHERRLQTELTGSHISLFLRHRLFASLLLPNLTNVGYRAAFAQTGANLAAVVCALERYRLAEGEYPDGLDALAPRFIQRVPSDLINGQPLIYRRGQNGTFRLYSVGWNESDDGGVLGYSSHEGNVDPHLGDWIWAGP